MISGIVTDRHAIAVPIFVVEALRSDEVLSVRPLVKAG